MRKSEVTKLIGMLSAAYPKHNISPATLSVYQSMLIDLPAKQTIEEVRDLVTLSRFFPTIAEIRTAVFERELALPPAADAWQEVDKGMRHGGASERANFSHQLIAEVVATMNWRDMCLSTKPGVHRIEFCRRYEAARAKHIEKCNLESARDGQIPLAN